MKMEVIIDILNRNNVKSESGLSLEEIIQVESIYGVRFPPGLKELLQILLPVQNGFVNWRDFSENNMKSIKDRLSWPLEGMMFDIEHNSFWYDSWGEKPQNIEEAKEICRREFMNAPAMIPIYSHRYIPAEPDQRLNPVFSIYQTDIIYYGENLVEYFKIEYSEKQHHEMDFNEIKDIRFWKDLVG